MPRRPRPLLGLAALIGLGASALSGQAHAQLAWTEVTAVSGRNPALARAPGGGVHLIVAESSVRHFELDAQGNSLLDETVPGTDGVASSFEFGPAIGSGAGALHIAFARDEGNWMMRGFHVAKTSSGWSTALEVQAPAERGYAPSIAVDESGVAHLLFGQATNVPFGVANYYRVSAGAIDQSHPALLEWRADDRTSIVAGPGGAIHALAGYPSPSGHIAYAESSNSGSSFSAQSDLEPPGLGSERVGQPHATVDATGTVHAVFGAGEEAPGGCNCAVHYATISGGSVQSSSVVTPPGVLEPWHLSLGIARIGLLASGTRVVAWQRHAGDDSAAPVSSSTSSDGQSWTPPQLVADDCGGSEGRNTIDVVASDDVVWLACPKGSSVRVFRGVAGGNVPCNPASPFSGAAITPASGSGVRQSFVARLSHCEGADQFRILQLRVTKLVAAEEPAVAPSFEAGLLHLDTQSCAPGEAKQLASTYGTLDCASSSVSQNGNELAVTFALEFDTTTFAGERGLFMDAKGGSVSPEPRLGWTELGSFVVTADAPDGGNAGSGGAGGTAPGDRGGVSEDAGCGCRTRPGSSGSIALVALALLAALFGRGLRSRFGTGRGKFERRFRR